MRSRFLKPLLSQNAQLVPLHSGSLQAQVYRLGGEASLAARARAAHRDRIRGGDPAQVARIQFTRKLESAWVHQPLKTHHVKNKFSQKFGFSKFGFSQKVWVFKVWVFQIRLVPLRRGADVRAEEPHRAGLLRHPRGGAVRKSNAFVCSFA